MKKLGIILKVIAILGCVYLIAYSICKENPKWYDHSNAIVGGILIFMFILWLLADGIDKHFKND